MMTLMYTKRYTLTHKTYTKHRVKEKTLASYSPEKSDETCSMNRTKSKSTGEVSKCERGRKRKKKERKTGTRVHELINICIRKKRPGEMLCDILVSFSLSLDAHFFVQKETSSLSLSFSPLFFSSSIKQFFRRLDETFPSVFSLARSFALLDKETDKYTQGMTRSVYKRERKAKRKMVKEVKRQK